jgi:hypothetical protein
MVLKTFKIPRGTQYSWATVWNASWNLSRVFNTILYKSEFQNPQIFQQTISLFPEHSTLAKINFTYSQARIEHTNFIIGDTPGCLDALKKMFKNNKVNPSSNDQALPYKMSALRIGITLSALYFILIVILLPIATMFAQVVIIIGMSHCIFTGLPMLFICSHLNIKEYSVKRMKQLLCKNNVTDSSC